MNVHAAQRQVGAVDRDDAVQAIADLDAVQRHAAGAGDGDGVLPATVDNRFPHTLERDALRPDHDWAGTDAGERDDRIFAADVRNRGGERPLAAIERLIG